MLQLDVLILPADLGARARGQLHGERFADAIAELVAIRTGLCMKMGTFVTPDSVRRVARRHLPVLAEYDPELHEELLGIAEGAGLDPADLVILNHYTDLRDLDPALYDDDGAHPDPDAYADECTTLYGPAGDGALLAMTWDTHASATRFGLLLGVPEHTTADGEQRPATWMLSVVGCLGMAGLNRHGVGLVVNNLKTTDARIGPVWPAVVRRALCQPTQHGALHVLETSPLSSGRHYLIADSEHGATGIELSGALREVDFQGTAPYFHTNHSHTRIAEVTKIAPNSTTWPRFDTMARSLDAHPAIPDLADAWSRLALVSSSGDLSRHDQFATCAAIAMDLGARRAWATRGPATGAPQFELGFSSQGAPEVRDYRA